MGDFYSFGCYSSKTKLSDSSKYSFLVGSQNLCYLATYIFPSAPTFQQSTPQQTYLKEVFWIETFQHNSASLQGLHISLRKHEYFSHMYYSTVFFLYSPLSSSFCRLDFILVIRKSCARLWIDNISKDIGHTLQAVLSEYASLDGVEGKMPQILHLFLYLPTCNVIL